MSKITRAINIEDSIWNTAIVLYRGEISQKIEEYLRIICDLSMNEGHNKIKLLEEKEDLSNKMTEITAKLHQIKIQLGEIDKKEAKIKIDYLDKQQKLAVEGFKCDACKTIKNAEKIHTLKYGKICNTCFHILEADELKKYYAGDGNEV